MSQPQWDRQEYESQLASKADALRQRFAPLAAPTLEVHASEPQHYRLRAEFRLWHDGDDLYYIMFDSQTRQRIRVDAFPTASTLINALMPKVLHAARPSRTLRHKLFQVDFLTTLSGEALISLLYHRQLDEAWQAEAAALRAQLRAEGFTVDIIGRAHKQKVVLERDHVLERLQVAGRELTYLQVENSFTQPNGGMNQQMLEWALDVTQGAQGDLLELYCGNGNFSLALARNFRRVLATEIAKPSVEAAQYNIQANAIDNVQILRMSAEEFTQAIQGERQFRRLAGIDLAGYECNTIFVDPPRAGLDPATLAMVQGYERILYISCNPETLLDNLQTLTQTHEIRRLALFDQFPYTHHAECGVYLTRR